MNEIVESFLEPQNTAEGYGRIRHVSVRFANGSYAHVSPTLFAKYGAKVLNYPGWYRGEAITADEFEAIKKQHEQA